MTREEQIRNAMASAEIARKRGDVERADQHTDRVVELLLSE
jgi:uncharacterized protein HemY